MPSAAIAAHAPPPVAPDWQRAVRSILVIKWSALGDAALASAILEDLHAAFPQAAIDLDTSPAAQPLYAADPRLRRVLTPDARAGGRLRAALRWLRVVRAGRYGLVVDLQCSDHSRLLLALLRLSGRAPRHCLGFRGGLPYRPRPPALPRRTPPLEAMRGMLARAGIAARARQPVLHVPAALAEDARRRLDARGLAPGTYAVFMPGSQAAGRLKRWSAESYAALGRLLLDAGAAHIVVLGAADEAGACTEIAARIESSHPGRALWLRELALPQIVSVCAGARRIVANDTGIAHIAAAAGRPLLMLCGPTDPRRVKPPGTAVRAVQARGGCLDCYGKTCRYGGAPRCLARITPDAVAGLLADPPHIPADLAVY